MKIIFNKDTVCAAVVPLQSGVSAKSTLSAAEGILIRAQAPDTVVMTTYDLEKGVQITIHAEVVEEGSAIISASKFSQTVRAMDGGQITLTVDDRMAATIVCGRASHTMSTLPASDFPEIPRLTSPNGFVVAQSVLKRMISKCLYAMGVNDQRPVLNGLYFAIEDGHLDTVSCDSFKMAVCGTNAELKNMNADGQKLSFRFIVPNKSVQELFKLLDDKTEGASVLIYMSRKNIIFVTENTVFFSKLIEGDYIDYNRIILRNHRIQLFVSRESLIAALDRAALITEEKVVGSVRSHVKLEAVGDAMKITASSGAGSSYDELSIGHDGADIAIAFNNRYLIDSLRACRADMVRLSLSSPLTSINIEPVDHEGEDTEGDSELFMLLPVRMKE